MKYSRIVNTNNLLIGILLTVLFLIGIYGWSCNIQKLSVSPHDFDFWVRVLGVVFPPLGAILGYL